MMTEHFKRTPEMDTESLEQNKLRALNPPGSLGPRIERSLLNRRLPKPTSMLGGSYWGPYLQTVFGPFQVLGVGSSCSGGLLSTM